MAVFYDSQGNRYEGVGSSYNEKGQLALKQRYQSDPDSGATAIRNVYVDPNQKFYRRNPSTEPDPQDPYSLSSLGYNIPKYTPTGSGSISENLKKAGVTDEQLKQVTDPLMVSEPVSKDKLPKSASDKMPPNAPDGMYNEGVIARPAVMAFGYNPKTGQFVTAGSGTPDNPGDFVFRGNYESLFEMFPEAKARFEEGKRIGFSNLKPFTSTGNTNMAQSTPVTDVQKTIEERAGATTLPTGTQYVPEVQQVQREELLTPPNPLDTTDAVSPSLVSTENLDVTVPSQQNAEKYTASTIPGTPEAVAAQGKLSSESVIGDVQGAVSKESLVQAAQGKVSEQSTVKYQLEQLFSSFEEGKPLPAWAAPAVRNVGAMMQARGLGASSMASAAITQAIMESGIPIAKADADRYGQMDMANLSNQQQAVMQNAMTYASMDKANLDARMQVAVNNAKSFLSMDLQNLNNEQKMQEIDYAGQMQALTSNQAAENSAAQFNAQSQNQIDEFFAELGAQIETGNVNRRAAQDQFNVNEKNAIAQYNASLADARERFNTTMATQIAQSNAVWRREINTAETANQNAANQMNVQNLLGITQASLDALWQRYRDEAGWALKIAESQEQRFHEIGLLGMEIDANTDLYEMESDATFSTELGKAVLNGIFKVGTAYVNR